MDKDANVSNVENEDLESRVLELETENSELKKVIESLKEDNKMKTGWWIDQQQECEELNMTLKSIAFVVSKMVQKK